MNFFNNGCGNNSGCGFDCCTLVTLIILLQCLCGCGNNGGFDCCTLILLLLLCGCGNSGCGSRC